MLVINSYIPSFYIQKLLYSETTETSRVMDDPYVGEIPIPISPPNQDSFNYLCDYMLFLNKSEKKRTSEKELIEFIDKQLIDSLVHELYFKEIFKTNLVGLVEPFIDNVEHLDIEDEKMGIIKQVIKNLQSNGNVMKEIEKIKSHKWVKLIEGY